MPMGFFGVFSSLNHSNLYGDSSLFILHALDLTVEDLPATSFNLYVIPSSSDRTQASSDGHRLSCMCSSIFWVGKGGDSGTTFVPLPLRLYNTREKVSLQHFLLLMATHHI